MLLSSLSELSSSLAEDEDEEDYEEDDDFELSYFFLTTFYCCGTASNILAEAATGVAISYFFDSTITSF